MATTVTDIKRITPDGRTKLAKLLNEFDALYDAKRDAEKAADMAKARYDALADDIKAEVTALTPDQKLQLDSDKLEYVLDYSIGDRTAASKDGLAWLKATHPTIYAKVVKTTTVTTLRRLTGKLWMKKV